MDRFLLLDLHYTFAVDESWHRGVRLAERIPRETYRTWIIDLIRQNEVTTVLTTARPEVYARDTLVRIQQETKWTPNAAYFRQIEAQPHVAKEDNLRRIIEEWGEPQAGWIAFESNERTRSMYRRYGIKAMPVHRTPPLTEWPDGPPKKTPFALP